MAGLNKFVGSPCRRCRGTVRYVRNNTCVHCECRGKQARAPEVRRRMAAKERGARIFTSALPCRRCGGVIRHVSGGCVACARDRQRAKVAAVGHAGPVSKPEKSSGSPVEAARRPSKPHRGAAAGISTGGPPPLEIHRGE